MSALEEQRFLIIHATADGKGRGRAGREALAVATRSDKVPFPFSTEKIHFQHTAELITHLIKGKANYSLQVSARPPLAPPALGGTRPFPPSGACGDGRVRPDADAPVRVVGGAGVSGDTVHVLAAPTDDDGSVPLKPPRPAAPPLPTGEAAPAATPQRRARGCPWCASGAAVRRCSRVLAPHGPSAVKRPSQTQLSLALLASGPDPQPRPGSLRCCF